MNNCLLSIRWAGLLAALLAGCANSPPSGISDIPESLRVPATEVLAQQARAAGVQVYRCSADKDAAAHFEWSLTGPEADLFDHAGHQSAGTMRDRTWEARDGNAPVSRAKSLPVPLRIRTASRGC